MELVKFAAAIAALAMHDVVPPDDVAFPAVGCRLQLLVLLQGAKFAARQVFTSVLRESVCGLDVREDKVVVAADPADGEEVEEDWWDPEVSPVDEAVFLIK